MMPVIIPGRKFGNNLILYKLSLTMLLLLLSMPCSSLGKESCFATLEKSLINYGENVHYTITVTYAVNTIPPVITPPVFEHFTIMDEFSTITEAGTSGLRYKIQKRTWALKPAITGRLLITPATVTFRDTASGMLKNESINPFYVDVKPDNVNKAQNTSSSEPGSEYGKAARGKIVLYAVLASAAIVLIMLAALYIRKKYYKNPGNKSVQ